MKWQTIFWSIITVLFISITIISASAQYVTDVKVGETIIDGKSVLNQQWANLTVEPTTAFSISSSRNFTQKLTLCNNAQDDGYFFLDYFFNNPLMASTIYRVDDWEKTELIDEPIVECSETGDVQLETNETVCVTKGYDQVEYKTNGQTKTLLKDVEAKQWGVEKHYVNPTGELYQSGECKSYVLNYKTFPEDTDGKWNFKVWANNKDDWTCIQDSSCPFDYTLDPTFSANYTYKQNIQLNFSKVHPTRNNVTVSIELTSSNYNFNRNQVDGDDFVFVNFDETTALGCYKESFVNGTLGNFSILVTNFSNTTNTSIWMYHGNSGMSNQYCAEINNAYLLADLMNTSSVNSTIWNQAVGTAWSGSSNGYYQASTSAAQGCGLAKVDAVCGLTANTAGKLKQSQSYEVLYTAKDTGGGGNSCGHGVSWGTSSVYSSIGTNYESNVRSFMVQNDATLGAVPAFVFTNALVAVRARKINGISPTATILELWNSSNSSLDLGLSPVMVRNNITAGENVTGVFTLANIDGSSVGTCPNTLFYDIRVKSYINTSIGLNMTGSDLSLLDASINITNQTWDAVLHETEVGNYTVNVSWNANIVNYVLANFTVEYSKAGVFTNIITNGSGSVGGNIKWTQFNISLPLNFTDNNTDNHSANKFGHHWNFTIDTNSTDITNTTSQKTQFRDWSYWVNNVTWTSSVISLQSNTFHFNLSKIIPQASIVGLTYNITLEYNGVNQSPNATLVLNSTNYEDYDFTMLAPAVTMTTVYNWTAWLNINYQHRLTVRRNQSSTIIVNGSQTVVGVQDTVVLNDTWESSGVFETGVANFSINITFDSNAYNNVSAVNFTYNGRLMMRDVQIQNVSYGNTTMFNVSIAVPLAEVNASSQSFNWTFLLDGNVTDSSFYAGNRTQPVLWAFYVNNQTYISPLISGRLNPITVNFSKHVNTGNVKGLQINVTNEWNLTASVLVNPFTYRKNIQINSTKAYQAVNNYTVNVLLNLSNHDFNHTQPDGDDVAFYNFDQTTLLGCYKESFVNTTMGNYSVLITNLSNATNTSIWVYYGNTTMPNQCPEINNAFLLADLMNSSTINSSIWNERQGNLWFPDTTNGSYKAITSITDICDDVSSNTVECYLTANTSGLLKQSQTYEVDTSSKFDNVNGCGWGIVWSQTASSGRIGSSNISFLHSSEALDYEVFYQDTSLLAFKGSGTSTAFFNHRLLKINNNDARTIYDWRNSSAGSLEINLNTALNTSVAPNTFLNTSNKFTLIAAQNSVGATGCITTLITEIRVRSYINSTLNYTFSTEGTIPSIPSTGGTNRTATQLLVNNSNYEEWNLTFRAPFVYNETNVSMKGWLNITFNGSMVIRDPTFTQVLIPLSVNVTFTEESLVWEEGKTNYSANVSWNANDINYVVPYFFWIGVNNIQPNYTDCCGNFGNISGSSGGNIRWTYFNITTRPNMTADSLGTFNNSNYAEIKWGLTMITNSTNITNVTSLSNSNQKRLWSHWINNVTWDSVVLEGSSQTFHFNLSNILNEDIQPDFILNVTLEYNGTNLTPNASLIVNNTNYQDYILTFITPSVGSNVTVNWTAWFNLSFQHMNVFLERTRKFRNNSVIVNGTQTIITTSFTLLYSNYTNNGSYDFVRGLVSDINFSCLSGSANLLRNINDSLSVNYSFVCGSPIVFNNSYVHSMEGNYSINWTLVVNNLTTFESPNRQFISDLFNPIVNVDLTSSLGFFNVSSAFNITLNCTDNMYSPLNYTLLINQTTLIFNGTRPNSTNQTNLTSLQDGVNIITGMCADPFGSNIDVFNITLFLKNLALIDERNNTACDVGNLTGARVYIDDNSTYFDYKYYNTSTINISQINYTSINTTRLRFELVYSSGAIITRYIDVSLFNDTSNVRVCCNPEGVDHFEQLITSAITRPVWLKSIFSNCYVAADYTRFVFQDRKVLKAFTIERPYYLTTIINRGQVFLASLDGSIQTEINLDTLELIATPLDFSIISSALSFHNGGANTTTILYNNSANDNSNGTLVITDITNNAVLFNSTMATPNNWILVFDYTTMNLTNSTMFQVTYTALTVEGLTKVTKAFFTGRGASGLILNSIAAVVAILLLLFGLSVASARITFAWLGIVVSLAALTVLFLATGGVWYITFLQAISVIVMVYIVISMVKQSGDVLT